MFEQLFTYHGVLSRHRDAPWSKNVSAISPLVRPTVLRLQR